MGAFATQRKTTLTQRRTPTGLWLCKVTLGHLIEPNNLYLVCCTGRQCYIKVFLFACKPVGESLRGCFSTSKAAMKEFWNWVFCRLYKRIFLILLSSSDQMLTNKTGKNLIFNQNWTCTGAIVASWPDNSSAGSIATAPPRGQDGARHCYQSEVTRPEKDQIKRAKGSLK